MNRAAVAADIIDALRLCLGEGCSYELTRSRGDLPAECNTISLSWLPRRQEFFSDCGSLADCDDATSVDQLQILVTRCCAGIDGQVKLDLAAEDREEACFWDDIETIETCLNCLDLNELRADHNIQVFKLISTTPDTTVRGGCYSARLRVEIRSMLCCPVVP